MNTQTFTSRLSSRKESLTSIIRKAQERVSSTTTSWLNPERSIGRYIGKAGRDNVWDAVGPARDVFNKIAPIIKAHLESVVEPISSRVIWSMYMIGKAPSSAAPSIIFCCEVLEHRREVRNAIKESDILNRYPGIKTGHMPRPPDFTQLVPLADGDELQGNCGTLFMLCSQSRSACGSQILLTTGGESPGKCTAKATIGGVIRLGNNYYYTTAAHALQPGSGPIAGCQTPRSDEDHVVDDDAFSWDGSDTTDSATTSCHEEASLITFMPDDQYQNLTDLIDGLQAGIPRQRQFSQIKSDGSSSSACDLPGLLFSPIDEPFMTSADSEDHAAGLDYALVKVSSRDHILENFIELGIDNQSVVNIQFVFRSEPQDVEILAVTSRGAIRGYISGTPSYSSAPGHRSFNKMFKINLDGPLKRGDCGTWIIDAKSGDLYGHIVAGSPGDGVALIAPFAAVFKDIQRRLGQSPCLPAAGEGIANVGTDDNSVKIKSQTDIVIKMPQSQGPSHHSATNYGATGTMEDIRTSTFDFEDEVETLPLYLVHEEAGSSQEDSFAPRAQADLSKESERLEEKRSNKLEQGSSEPQNSESGEGDDAQDDAFMDLKAKGSLTSPEPISPPPSYDLHSLPTISAKHSTEAHMFRDLLFSLSQTPVRWENPGRLHEALQDIDLRTIYGEAEEEANAFIAEAASRGYYRQPEWGYRDCMIRALIRYFKRGFFFWIASPPCEACHTPYPTARQGVTAPTHEETDGGASVVELYQCSNRSCSAQVRFPRYSDSWTLMQTRQGRVEEWANCFGMLCRAFGFRVRWVWNSEGHVWIEVYSEHQKRWVHVDVSEGAWDEPRLYTEIWGKKLSYCIAFSVAGATDVTRRYVQSPDYALPRTKCSEEALLSILQEIRTVRHMEISKQELRLENDDATKAGELQLYVVKSLPYGDAKPFHPHRGLSGIVDSQTTPKGYIMSV